MIKPRLAFATPFVLVVGCKAPAPTSPREDEQTREDETPVVVAIPQPVDAAAPIVDVDAAVVARIDAGLSFEERYRGNPVCCREPRKVDNRWRPPEHTGNPPGPQPAMRTQVVKYEVQEATLILTFGVGTDHGVVPKRDEAYLLFRDTNLPLEDGAIKILRCTRSMCVGTVKRTLDEVKMNYHVAVRVKDYEP